MTATPALRRALAVAFAALFATLPSVAWGQRLQVQQFRPMPSQTSNYFHVARAATPIAGTWELGLVLNWAGNPLVIQTQQPGESAERTGEIITHMLVLDALGAISITDWFELGIAVPVYLYDNGETGQGFGRFELDNPPNQGLGDLRLVPRFQLHEWGGDTDDRFALGLSIDFMLPTATHADQYHGEDFRVEPRLAFDARLAPWATWSINGGVLLRPNSVDVENITAGQSATFGTAALFRVTRDDTVFIGPELTGLVSITGEGVDLEEVPLELRGGVKWFPRGVDGLMVEGGAGGGIIEGFGTPDYRLFAGITYQRTPRAEDEGCYPSPYPDDDGDLVCETPDNYGMECDICRPRLDGEYPESHEIIAYSQREDAAHYWRYGYYPDMSTDDGIDEDDDGMPDACDICRPQDACNPLYRTDDGTDADGDGIPDGCDYCPEGSDLIDTDGDCISDCLDECPEDPELWNGEFDEDGCPEQYACSVADVCPDNLNEFPIVDQAYGGVPFFFDYDVFWEFSERVMNGYDRATNEVLIAQMAAILVDLADCLDYRLVAYGHTDTDGNLEYNQQLGLNRANFVREQLVAALIEAGMDATRAEGMVTAESSGESNPLNPDDPNDDYAVGNRENRRVILQITGCGEIGSRGPEAFEPVCPELGAGLRCGPGFTR